MFLTYKHARIDSFELFGGDPIGWSYVEHNIHRPWFYAAAVEQGNGYAQHTMLMLSDHQPLRSLIDDQESHLRIESVLLVTPDHINNSGRWMMEPLESIVRFEAIEGVAYVYQVLGDKIYIYGDAEAVGLKEARRETLFSISMLSPAS